MKVIADYAWGGHSGIGRYAAEVTARKPNDVLLQKLIRRGPASPLSPITLGRITRKLSGDAFWSPGFMPPAACPIPFIVTVHDLNHRHNYGPAHRWYYDKVLRRILKGAAAIITVSSESRSAIASWSGLRTDRIHISYLGVDETVFNPTGPPPEEVKGNYFLCFASSRPNKNLPGIFLAFARASLATAIRLVLVGEPNPAAMQLADRAGVSARCLFTGAITDQQLAQLYRGATALLYPSFSEGFGLPIIEALACGTTVIAADCPSVLEFARDSVLKVDPAKPDSIAAAILAAQRSPSLRSRLRHLGIAQASHPALKWPAVAAKVWSTVRAAANISDAPANGGPQPRARTHS